jgi:hypothetical protein
MATNVSYPQVITRRQDKAGNFRTVEKKKTKGKRKETKKGTIF